MDTDAAYLVTSMQALAHEIGMEGLFLLRGQGVFFGAIIVWGLFVAVCLMKTHAFPSLDESVRAAFVTLTLLTSVLAACALLLTSPPAIDELSLGTLRWVGFVALITGFSYALPQLHKLFFQPRNR